MKTLLTGIKPTGSPHLGNYVGMISPTLDLANKKGNKTFVFVANYHALNSLQDKFKILDNTYDIAATMFALGLDPEEITFFKQSDIPEVFELATILTNFTSKGLMNRAHAYKATVDKNTELGNNPDHAVNMGLYNYPILMAADILMYDSDIVPVGKDQVQHVEIARDIAGVFNHQYGDTFKLPEYFVAEDAEAIPGLDGRKMSKSYDNTIPLFVDEVTLKKLINRIVTDSKQPNEPKDPDSSTIVQLYKLFASESDYLSMREQFVSGGIGYGTAKNELFEVVNESLKEPRKKYHEFLSDTAMLDKMLKVGSDKARARASLILSLVRSKIGA